MKDLLEKGAVLQRDKETYAIAPHIPAGLVTSDPVSYTHLDVYKRQDYIYSDWLYSL